MIKASALILAAVLGTQGQLRGTQPVPQQQPFLHRDSASRVLYTKILEAEDQRVYSPALGGLLARPHAGVRRRAALAIGRIGDPAGVAPLLGALEPDGEHDQDVRADMVFALGEIESAAAVQRLLDFT